MDDNKLIINMDSDGTGNEKSEENPSYHRAESSHSHHHSHSHKKHRGNRKLKKFLKRNKYKLFNFLAVLIFIAVLIFVAGKLDSSVLQTDNKPSSAGSDEQAVQASVTVEIPVFDEEVVLVNSFVRDYMNSDADTSIETVFGKFISSGRADIGLPVTLWYNAKNVPSGCSVMGAELFVSDKKDFSSPMVFSLESDTQSIDVYNLKTGKQYYFRFIVTLSNGTEITAGGSFKTAEGPRMLYVDGIRNVRDFGGWKTVDGKRIRQGTLYRSTELDGAVVPEYKITSDGVNTMLALLGIKNDFDLRNRKDNPNGLDALGAGVQHNYYAMPMYSDVFTESGKAAVRSLFHDLALSGKTPSVLHCTHGADRAGTVCFLLGAVLGVSEEDLMRDYKLSAFAHGEMWGEEQMNDFVLQLKSYEGETLQKKAENYLLSAGVTPDEIATLRVTYIED